MNGDEGKGGKVKKRSHLAPNSTLTLSRKAHHNVGIWKTFQLVIESLKSYKDTQSLRIHSPAILVVKFSFSFNIPKIVLSLRTPETT